MNYRMMNASPMHETTHDEKRESEPEQGEICYIYMFKSRVAMQVLSVSAISSSSQPIAELPAGP